MATRETAALVMLDRLADLARGWLVEISTTRQNEPDEWFTVEIRHRDDGEIFTYSGPNLPRLVAAAWAGEPSGPYRG